MPRPLACQFCRTPLDPAQQFAFHVQDATAGDRHQLTGGRRLPHAHGRPLRCCRGCEGRVAVRPPDVRMLVSAAVLLGTGAVTVRLGKWLAGV